MTWSFLHIFYEDILVSRSQARKHVIKLIDIMLNSNKSILGLLIDCGKQIVELHDSFLSLFYNINKIFQRDWKNTKIQSIFNLLGTKISHRRFVLSYRFRYDQEYIKFNSPVIANIITEPLETAMQCVLTSVPTRYF